jgi:hypothetical protein
MPMRRRLAKACFLMGVFLLTIGSLCLANLAVAQTNRAPRLSRRTLPKSPRTTESDLVLVPVFVYDPARLRNAANKELPCARATVGAFFKLPASQPYLPKDCDVTEVHGLQPADFRVFQGGVEQPIVKMDAGAWWTLVRDNFGWHMQSSYEPRGIWSLSDLKPVPVVNRDFYLLAYLRPDTKPGCHHIRVETDRPNLLLFARDQYCTGQTPSDPLIGTGPGRELENILASRKTGKIPLTVQAGAFHASGDKARVDVSLLFPWHDLYRQWEITNWTLYARIRVMGVLRRKDGTIVARFSDILYPSYWPTFDQGGAKFISWEEGTEALSPLISHRIGGPLTPLRPGYSGSEIGNDTLALLFVGANAHIFRIDADPMRPDYSAIKTGLESSDPFWIPTRYETQIDVAPGDYDLQVVLSDELNFGRVETPVSIDPYNGKELALSSIALCKRLRDVAVAAKEDVAANFAPRYVPLVSKGIEFTPAGDTSFNKGEALYAYFEVYEPALSEHPDTSVAVEMRVVDPGTDKVRAAFAVVNATPYEQSGSTTLRVARTVPIRQLTKGSYILQVRASDSAGATTPWRTANFSIE